MSEEWVSVNGHLDYHSGWVDSGIADAIEAQFGVYPEFGIAGGCINMVLRLESGHVLDINDAEEPLTPVHDRDPSDGFSIAIYRSDDDHGWGRDPVLTLVVAMANPQDLPNLIAQAIRQLANATSDTPVF